MITYKIRRTVNCPCDVLIETVRDHQVEMNKKLPNIRSSREIARERLENGKLELKMEVAGRSHIPVFLRKVVDNEKIKWLVHQEWDDENGRCDYKVEALYFRDNVDVTGAWMFKEVEPGKTEILIHNKIRIDASGVKGIPSGMTGMVSRFVEQALYSTAKPSLMKIIGNIEELAVETAEGARASA